jgi:hypothetical protein
MLTKIVRKIKPSEGPRELDRKECVGCGCAIRSNLECYKGSIISGVSFTEVTLEDHTWQTPPWKVTKRVGYHTRVKGFLCLKCAAITTVITKQDGSWEPVVKTDAAPGTFELSIPLIERTMEERHAPVVTANLNNHKGGVTGSAPPDNHWLDVGRRRK